MEYAGGVAAQRLCYLHGTLVYHIIILACSRDAISGCPAEFQSTFVNLRFEIRACTATQLLEADFCQPPSEISSESVQYLCIRNDRASLDIDSAGRFVATGVSWRSSISRMMNKSIGQDRPRISF